MSEYLFSYGFSNLCFVHHGAARISAAVRGVIHAKLFHQRQEVFFVIIVVFVLFTVGTMNEIFAVGIFKPGFVELKYFFSNRNFANAALGLTGNYIKVPFFKVNIFLLEIKKLIDSYSRIYQH